MEIVSVTCVLNERSQGMVHLIADAASVFLSLYKGCIPVYSVPMMENIREEFVP